MADDHVLEIHNSYITTNSLIKPVKPVTEKAQEKVTDAINEKSDLKEKPNGQIRS